MRDLSYLKQLKELQAVIEKVAQGELDEKVQDASEILAAALRKNKPVLVCGNGGSASDAMHIAGELVGRFKRERRGLNVRALVADPAITTAWTNDYDYDSLFSRQVEAYGAEGGVVLGLSTSGNSRNVLKAFEAAKKLNMKAIAMTGESGGLCKETADVLINVPSDDTPRIQEIHITMYHYMCEFVEYNI